jgi:hypothetical protein
MFKLSRNDETRRRKTASGLVRLRRVATCIAKKQVGKFETRQGEWIFLIYLIFPAALDPQIYSASNRNEYQKHTNNVSWE